MSCFISPPSSSSDEERSPSPPSMMFRTGSGASLASEGLPDGYSPTRLLTLAIQKRRRLYNSKDRDYRAELLQTAFIQSLCKHLGERRAARKKLRAGVSLGEARKRLHQQCASPVEAADEQPVQKCARSESVPDSPMSPPSSPPRDQDMDEEDPFGLEQFFADLRKKSVQISAKLWIDLRDSNRELRRCLFWNRPGFGKIKKTKNNLKTKIFRNKFRMGLLCAATRNVLCDRQIESPPSYWICEIFYDTRSPLCAKDEVDNVLGLWGSEDCHVRI